MNNFDKTMQFYEIWLILTRIQLWMIKYMVSWNLMQFNEIILDKSINLSWNHVNKMQFYQLNYQPLIQSVSQAFKSIQDLKEGNSTRKQVETVQTWNT